MKKNKFLRLASVLIILCLITTCAVSGTFAKYTTGDNSQDTARVAKFGVEVAVEVDGAFATEYDALANVDDANGNAIAKTVISSTTDNLVAPGTKGDLLELATITGTPEVAVNIKREATLVLTGWEVGTDYYCPIKIVVSNKSVGEAAATETILNGNSFTSAAEFIAAVEATLDSDVNYGPNTNLAETHSITWEWAFEGGVGQDDVKDTALGDKAADGTDIIIDFTFKITVTQID